MRKLVIIPTYNEIANISPMIDKVMSLSGAFDLLIIDDLGTELVNTFTTSQLFYVVNERLNRKKGTIISTNLPVNEMRDEFTDRVMSRIVSQYQIIPLYGEDIRIRKKLENR